MNMAEDEQWNPDTDDDWDEEEAGCSYAEYVRNGHRIPPGRQRYDD